ncbi:hypothetical protein [Leptolyngbya sp. NK1-12]|uniref:hypothetical protein n=1 Tax=Leptolyngbya sp. NK1-12 TaxID=2547451 RepID=UPI003B636785
MYGGAGADRLYSGGGRDDLYGEGGNDQLWSTGGGSVNMYGGSGADSFYYGSGGVTVFDYNAFEGDKVLLPNSYRSGISINLIDPVGPILYSDIKCSTTTKQ